MSLRDQIVKLAYDNPGEIRDKLLPVLAKTVPRLKTSGQWRLKREAPVLYELDGALLRYSGKEGWGLDLSGSPDLSVLRGDWINLKVPLLFENWKALKFATDELNRLEKEAEKVSIDLP